MQALATIPEFLWELSLGLYLTFKGFNRHRRSSPRTRRAGRRRPPGAGDGGALDLVGPAAGYDC